jgi:hypothetical protein
VEPAGEGAAVIGYVFLLAILLSSGPLSRML